MTDSDGTIDAQASAKRIRAILAASEAELLARWLKEQQAAVARRTDLLSDGELSKDSTEFLRYLRGAVASGSLSDIHGAEWGNVRDMLARLSRLRAAQGFGPSETASFVLSFKKPLFQQMRVGSKSAEALADDIWVATMLLDALGLYTIEMYQKTREEVIIRQQEEMLELSTPVVQLWEGILALPLIGTLDSARTQVVMESLLQAVVDTGSRVAIIDITGVPTVDTLVSQHLLKTVAAARLMGADCIISGIRPQIAQTIVHLGVDLSQVATKATLAEAFILALQRTGRSIGRGSGGSNGAAPSASRS